MEPQTYDIMALIARAPWREAVTYRDTWPHEYVVVKKDGQQALLAEFRARIARGEGVECRFFGQKRKYLFLGEHKYWTMTDCPYIDLDADDYVLNRALLYRDRRDFVIRPGDTGMRGGEPGMDTPEEGIEQLDVRTMWQHEALDFTPWLARNLDLLGEELGMKLELVQQEKQIGPLYLDILAREADEGVLVAIENQLAWTDIGHLGQLLTYATGSDAHVAIWVAPEFRYEYAKALHRLNEWTRDEIRFYGVKVEVVKKTGESCPEPRFRKVVYPGGWNKDITLPSDPPVPPCIQKYRDFFQPLIAELVGSNFAGKGVYHFDYTGRFFPSRLNNGLGYAASLEGKNDAWVTLHIRMEDKEQTKCLFDQLHADREQIQDEMKRSVSDGPALEWHWNRWDNLAFSSINIRKDGSIGDCAKKLEETREWMLDLLPKLKDVFDPRVAAILERATAVNDG